MHPTRPTRIRSIVIAAGAMLLGAVTGPLHAAVIGIDIDDGGSAPTNWNQHQSGVFLNLINETGAATSVDVTISTSDQNFDQDINAGTLPSHVPDLSGLGQFELAPESVTFSDLEPGAEYWVWIFSVYDVPFGPVSFDATVTGFGAPSVFSFNQNTAGNLLINGSTGSSAQPLETYAAIIIASQTGTIGITFAHTGTGVFEIPLSGVAIELTPEPSSAVLLAFGLFGLTASIRRKRVWRIHPSSPQATTAVQYHPIGHERSTMKTTTTLALFSLALCGAPGGQAANIAYDDASDAAYDPPFVGWQDGDNGGSGFGEWDIDEFEVNEDEPGTNVGFFISTSTANGDGDSNGDDDIDTGGEAFGIFTDTGDGAVATRPFTGGPLAVGQTFTLTMDADGFDDPDSTSAVGFTLSNDLGDRLAFGLFGEEDHYQVFDSTGFHDTGIPATDEGLAVAVTLTGVDRYALAINGSPTLSGTLVAGQPITLFRIGVVPGNVATGESAFFNSFRVVPEPATGLLTVGLLGLAASIRRKRVSRHGRRP